MKPPLWISDTFTDKDEFENRRLKIMSQDYRQKIKESKDYLNA